MPVKKTILIAEDEAAMLSALKNKFEKEGFAVIAARDGEEALKLFSENKPDLIVLDIVMPKMNGIEAVKKIRSDNKRGRDIPIVMLTNLSDALSVSEASKLRVYDFLVKTDWRLDDIVALIRKKLDIT